MRNWLRAFSLAAGSLFLMANHLTNFNYWEAVYITHMYSDGTHQDEVGRIVPECGPNYAQYYQEGTYTYHQVDELVGYCTEMGMMPLDNEH